MIDDKYFDNDLYWKEHINRQLSMFAADIDLNKETLRREIENKSVCVV